MTDPAQASPEQLERAERIANEIGERRSMAWNTWDQSREAALAAILQSDQQQAELLAFVADVAKQKLPDELEDPDGDYEGAYKIIVTRARSAFREFQQGGRSDA